MLKHKVMLIVIPLMLALVVTVLTKEPKLSFTSGTVLYTGLASGSSIEMEKSFNYFATNTAFDNLINIIKSRETQEQVAIRLLSQHLLLSRADPKYISPKLYAAFKEKIPGYLYKYVVNSNIKYSADSSAPAQLNNNDSVDDSTFFPSVINKSDYKKTVANLTALMHSNDTNFVYKLLNYQDEHYSIKAISTIKAERLNNSDLIKLTYEVNDPGICQQTLVIFNDVCIENYKKIKENRSDAVVKYFEAQLAHASAQLKNAEAQLLSFNKSNNIINYYEQSKAVAVVKEDMQFDYNNKKALLAGAEAEIKKLEEKLDIQQLVQLKSNSVLERRKQLGDIKFEIASAEASGVQNDENIKKIEQFKKEEELLQNDIKSSVGELYHYQNSVEGLPINTTLSQWIVKITEAENLKAKIKVIDESNKDFEKQYSIYAPAGANIKKIEREISVSEQGYLELLHGLNLAKLKLQDNELTSNLKTVDPPYYPLQAMPTKRAVLVVAAGLVGFILVLGVILVMEYLDDTLKNGKKAAKILQIPALGMIPKISLNPGRVNLSFVQNRLLEIITQNIEQGVAAANPGGKAKTLVFVSTGEKEGKSVLSANIAKKLIQKGNKVLVLQYGPPQQKVRQQRRFPIVSRLLGYQDPRVDFDNPFLADPSTYLPSSFYYVCDINEQYLNAGNYVEILKQRGITLSFIPDYVLIELPSLINNNYPAKLIVGADMPILICRANRLWADADQVALDNIQSLSGNKLHFIINGVDIKETEMLLGDLPKKTSSVRKKIKNFFRFQFFSKNQI
jgi:polysaccharide biosynthesis transport protein